MCNDHGNDIRYDDYRPRSAMGLGSLSYTIWPRKPSEPRFNPRWGAAGGLGRTRGIPQPAYVDGFVEELSSYASCAYAGHRLPGNSVLRSIPSG
jgi:hypothetical protein